MKGFGREMGPSVGRVSPSDARLSEGTRRPPLTSGAVAPCSDSFDSIRVWGPGPPPGRPSPTPPWHGSESRSGSFESLRGSSPGFLSARSAPAHHGYGPPARHSGSLESLCTPAPFGSLSGRPGPPQLWHGMGTVRTSSSESLRAGPPGSLSGRPAPVHPGLDRSAAGVKGSGSALPPIDFRRSSSLTSSRSTDSRVTSDRIASASGRPQVSAGYSSGPPSIVEITPKGSVGGDDVAAACRAGNLSEAGPCSGSGPSWGLVQGEGVTQAPAESFGVAEPQYMYYKPGVDTVMAGAREDGQRGMEGAGASPTALARQLVMSFGGRKLPGSLHSHAMARSFGGQRHSGSSPAVLSPEALESEPEVFIDEDPASASSGGSRTRPGHVLARASLMPLQSVRPWGGASPEMMRGPTPPADPPKLAGRESPWKYLPMSVLAVVGRMGGWGGEGSEGGRAWMRSRSAHWLPSPFPKNQPPPDGSSLRRVFSVPSNLSVLQRHGVEGAAGVGFPNPTRGVVAGPGIVSGRRGRLPHQSLDMPPSRPRRQTYDGGESVPSIERPCPRRRRRTYDGGRDVRGGHVSRAGSLDRIMALPVLQPSAYSTSDPGSGSEDDEGPCQGHGDNGCGCCMCAPCCPACAASSSQRVPSWRRWLGRHGLMAFFYRRHGWGLVEDAPGGDEEEHRQGGEMGCRAGSTAAAAAGLACTGCCRVASGGDRGVGAEFSRNQMGVVAQPWAVPYGGGSFTSRRSSRRSSRNSDVTAANFISTEMVPMGVAPSKDASRAWTARPTSCHMRLHHHHHHHQQHQHHHHHHHGGALSPCVSPEVSSACHGKDQLPMLPTSLWGALRRMARDMGELVRGPEGGPLALACCLALFNQGMASTSVIAYGPKLIVQMGSAGTVVGGAASSGAQPLGAAAPGMYMDAVGSSSSSRARGGSLAGASSLASQGEDGGDESAGVLFTALVTSFKLTGILLSMALLDTVGRRALLLAGSAACCLFLAVLALAEAMASPLLLVSALCLFIFSFASSWAAGYWVIVSELFSLRHKSAAVATATLVLFLAGAASDALFLTIHRALHPYGFLVFAAVAAVGGLYVHAAMPETKGRTLEEIQALLLGDQNDGGLRPRGVFAGWFAPLLEFLRRSRPRYRVFSPLGGSGHAGGGHRSHGSRSGRGKTWAMRLRKARAAARRRLSGVGSLTDAWRESAQRDAGSHDRSMAAYMEVGAEAPGPPDQLPISSGAAYGGQAREGRSSEDQTL
eukprot:jgi/Mesvir1/26227/Mv02404-RA.1